MRKPDWLKVSAPRSPGYLAVHGLLRRQRLQTVCAAAACPNRGQCWEEGTAAFLILGGICTRRCAFCAVPTGRPEPVDGDEPRRLAATVQALRLRHVVITSVDRDDLADGGAAHFAACIQAVRDGTVEGWATPTVEVLPPDFRGKGDAVQTVLAAAPTVFNHNMETVARLQRAVRPSAGYHRSLTVLARSVAAGLTTKSGMMVGLGESADEIEEVLVDLASVGVSIATIGQYLRPTAQHLPVARYWEPAEFDDLAERGRRAGLAHVQSSPLTRSSYHAREALSDATPLALPSRR